MSAAAAALQHMETMKQIRTEHLGDCLIRTKGVCSAAHARRCMIDTDGVPCGQEFVRDVGIVRINERVYHLVTAIARHLVYDHGIETAALERILLG